MVILCKEQSGAEVRGGGGTVCSSHLKLHTAYLSLERRLKLSKGILIILQRYKEIIGGEHW